MLKLVDKSTVNVGKVQSIYLLSKAVTQPHTFLQNTLQEYQSAMLVSSRRTRTISSLLKRDLMIEIHFWKFEATTKVVQNDNTAEERALILQIHLLASMVATQLDRLEIHSKGMLWLAEQAGTRKV